MLTRPLLLLTLSTTTLYAQPQLLPPNPQPSPTPTTQLTQPTPQTLSPLQQLLNDYLTSLNAQDPLDASLRGNDSFASLLRDESPAAYEHRNREAQSQLARAKAIDPATLSPNEQLDLQLLIHTLQLSVDGARFHTEQLQLDSLSGPHIWLPQMPTRIPLTTPAERAGYVDRLEAIPTHLAQITEQLRAGIKAGRVPPRVVLSKTLSGIRALCNEDARNNPELSPFYKPFASSPPQDPLAARALAAIKNGITPAFQTFATFIETEYLPACRETIGASQGIDGPDYYNFCLRNHTTTNLTADQIHTLGLQQVAALKAEMIATIRETGFTPPTPTPTTTTTDDDLLQSFLASVRADERFRWPTTQAMMTDYRDLCKRIDAELPALFSLLPRNTYGVREIPAFAARFSPAAYYYPGSARTGIPGYFMVNTSNLGIRSTFSKTSLTMHEAVPGHHFQIAIAQELAESSNQHPFRSTISVSAFVEGWALYAERLGLEMGDTPGSALTPTAPNRGFYQNPYDNFGRLSDELWRACRLVVDTGIHSKNWTRQQAIDYLLTNSAISTLDAESEVDRYIGWPGQACAYKLGQLEILSLRADTQRRLGPRFNIREFHTRLLRNGALPLPILRAELERWQ